MNVETINFDKESPYDVLVSATAGLGPDAAIEVCLNSLHLLMADCCCLVVMPTSMDQ